MLIKHHGTLVKHCCETHEKHGELLVKHHETLLKHCETSRNTQTSLFDATTFALDAATQALGK